MSGWRIRWSSAGRAAAIGAAVLAAIAVLPSLLSAEQPPPLPDDVGLAPAVGSQAALPPPAPLPEPEPPPAAPTPRKRSKPAPERRGQRRGPERGRHRDRHGKEQAEAVTSSPPAGSYTYTPGYSFANPSSEFGFER